MKADDVDVTDSDAMKRWMDDFNQRPFQQRAAVIAPLPGLEQSRKCSRSDTA